MKADQRQGRGRERPRLCGGEAGPRGEGGGGRREGGGGGLGQWGRGATRVGGGGGWGKAGFGGGKSRSRGDGVEGKARWRQAGFGPVLAGLVFLGRGFPLGIDFGVELAPADQFP